MRFKISLFFFAFLNLICVFANDDNTAPVLNSITTTPTTVEAGQNLTFIVNATDDISGVDYILININNPNGEQQQSISGSTSDQWTDLGEDNYSNTITLNEYAVSGEWYVSSVLIKDNADNSLTLISNEGDIYLFNVEETLDIFEHQNQNNEIKVYHLYDDFYKIDTNTEIINLKVYDILGKTISHENLENNEFRIEGGSNLIIILVETYQGTIIKKIIKL